MIYTFITDKLTILQSAADNIYSNRRFVIELLLSQPFLSNLSSLI